MTAFEAYQKADNAAWELRTHGSEMMADASKVMEKVKRILGLEHSNREAGFPCWTVHGVDGWFWTSLEALRAAEKENESGKG
jgi:hypothetical protein